MGEYLHNLGAGKDILNKPVEALIIKEKNDKLALSTLKMSVHQKILLRKWIGKWQFRKKIFTTHLTKDSSTEYIKNSFESRQNS